MRFSESLYQLSPSEVAKASWAPQRVNGTGTVSGLLTTLFIRFGPVPLDKVLVVVTASHLSEAGLAQLTETTQIAVNDANQAGLGALARGAPFTRRAALNFEAEAVLMPGEFLAFGAIYDAGAAINSLTAGFFGVLVPRANWQFGSLPIV